MRTQSELIHFATALGPDSVLIPCGPGLNRTTWDLKPTKDVLNDYGGEGQKFVKPGEYTVTLTCGKAKQTQKLQVDIAPGIETR